jgi:hypothetical protein
MTFTSLQEWKMGRSWARVHIVEGIGPNLARTVAQLAKTSPFALMTDETTDRGRQAQMAILIKVADRRQKKVRGVLCSMACQGPPLQ